jgi:hypothetical protein
MISDEAVEAAAKAAAQHLFCYTLPANFNGDSEYLEAVADRCGPMIAKAVLEAAAPYMLAEAQADAWDKAWANARGNYAALYTQRPIPEWVTLTNPYRSQA